VVRSASLAVRRQLGNELRRLRGPRRGADVAAGLGWSESKLSRIETARTGISAADLDALLVVLDVAEPDRVRLRELSRQPSVRAWWAQYSSAVTSEYEEYVALEAEATSMLEWEAQVVPGLLQTDEYARAVIEASADSDEPEIQQRRLALRMVRQTLLTQHPAPTLHIVLDESVLRREVGSREIMGRQLQRLHDSGQRPGITLQVLPFSAGAHRALAGAFTIFGFTEDERTEVAHIEGLVGGVLHEKAVDVAAYRRAFTDLRHRALDITASRDLLTEIGAELNSPS
jgi:transcriptional regulator with XRE-family HTH domain